MGKQLKLRIRFVCLVLLLFVLFNSFIFPTSAEAAAVTDGGIYSIISVATGEAIDGSGW